MSSKDLKNEDKALYKRIYATASNQMDLYSLFIELASKLVRLHGVASYIVPDSLIGRSNFGATREEIICKRTILNWVHINEVFASANVASLIYTLRNESQEDYSFQYIKAANVKQWHAGEYQVVSIKKSVVEKTDAFKVNFSTEGETNLLFKILNNDNLSSQMKMWRGEELGRQSDLISNVRSQKSLPILAGDNVHRYEPVTYSRFIDVNNVGKGNYDKPKILIRQLGIRINATLDLDRCVTLQSIYNLSLQDNDTRRLKFILGLLNSKLYDFVYSKASGDKQTFQRIILENIKQLPYPSATQNQQQPIIDLVDSILAKKKQNPQAETSVEESAIDKLVYQLYGLTEEEINLIERG